MRVIVWGKAGCGKTTDSKLLAKYHRCDNVLDEWRDHCEIPPNTLALTDRPPPYSHKADEIVKHRRG